MKYIFIISLILYSISFVSAKDSLSSIDEYMKDKGAKSIEHKLYSVNRCTALYMGISNTMALYADEELQKSVKQTYGLSEMLFRYSLVPYIDFKNVNQEEAHIQTKEIVASMLALYSSDMNKQLEKNVDPFYGYILSDINFCNLLVESVS